MLRWMIVCLVEAVILITLGIGAFLGLSLLVPPSGVSISGGAKLSTNEIVSFQLQINKQVLQPQLSLRLKTEDG